MTEATKRLAFSILLIVLAAALQLWSDRHNRHHGQARTDTTAAIPIAILQHSSNPMMEELHAGILAGLHSKSLDDGKNLAITTYNPEGDLPTGNLMAQKITGGDYRLAVSISTVMLQALANANRNGRVAHVFGAVTSPVAAGVGIKTLDSLDKPRHLTGIGTPQPVADIFRLAKQLNPALKTVGAVWNPTEVNSEFCTKQARAVAKELGLTLLEAPIEQAKDVREAAESLVTRGVEAFWTGGDATVNATVDSLIEVARNARIPVFSNISGHAKHGGLFDLGADYHEVGEEIGRIAADVLGGADPATLPVKDYVPKHLLLNEKTRSNLRDAWQFDPALYAQASLVIDKNGVETQLKPAGGALPLAAAPIALATGRTYKIGVAYFAPEPGIDSVMAGLREGLKALGLEEGRNLSFQTLHAQAEIAQIPTIGQVLDNSDVDAILTLTTPVLQGVGMLAKHKPVAFTYVTDPLAAGAGKSFTEHLPNLIGIGSFPPVADMLELTRKVLPGVRSLGTLYNPSEANSVKVAAVLRELCQKAGITLEEIPINTTSEVVQAAQAAVARKVGAIVAVGDNTMYQGVDAIAKVAKDANIPLILDQPEFIGHDALMVVGVDYKESGRAVAEPLVQLLAGVKPAGIAFRNVSKKSILLNEASAQRLHITFPDELRALAASSATTSPTAPAKALDHPWKIKRMLYVESPPAEEALHGIDDGLKAAGLQAGRDFVLNDASAQGDMSLLSGLADAAGSDGTELLITLSTPTLQTVLHKLKKIPIVFTFVANPIVAGAGTDDTHHLPNVTGVYTLAPFQEMVALLKEYFPKLQRVGTLFTPGEDNSVYNMDVFEKAATGQGLSVVKMPVNSASELPNAALAMASQPIDAWVQILDNPIVSGFTALTQAATRAKKPLFTFTESGVKQGAAIAYSMDYYQAGSDAALKAADIMRGKRPADIAFSKPSKIRLIISEAHAKALQLPLPAELVNKADQRLP
ncbi:MAG: ABC transporter substrate-binding protein [Methylovulum sp.]|nr:ABC transporter substrate-binding protein [Methylovulum sp.]